MRNIVAREISNWGAVFLNDVITPYETKVWTWYYFSWNCLGGSQPTVRMFRRMLSFCSKLEFTLEKKRVWSLLASRPVIMKWNRNSRLTYASERLLPIAFTVNLFCSAVNLVIFLNLDCCFVYFTLNKFIHLTSNIYT